VNCDEVRELLSPMTDREVDKEILKEVEEHLRTCKDCAFQSTMMVGMKTLLQKWGGVQPSPTFRTGILEKVQDAPPPGFFSRVNPTVWGSIVAALAVVGLVVVFAVTDPTGSSTQGQGDAKSAAGDEPRAEKPPATASSDPVAQVSFTRGAVYLTPAGEASSLGSAGDVLAPGYQIRVTESGAADLLLVGGFEMRLENGAAFTFAGPLAGGALRSGRVLLRSAEADASASGAKISCSAATIKLDAGPLAFSCECFEDETVRVIVAEGSLSVVVGQATHVVEAGTMVQASSEGAGRVGEDAPASELEHLKRWVRR